jgi:hypothetical protein
MKFSLVFENSGDAIPFTVVANEDLFEYFVDTVNAKAQNSFCNKKKLANEVNKKLTDLHWSISKTNEVLYSLISKSFNQHDVLADYLNQEFLNKTHADWVFSQLDIVDIDKLRFSDNRESAKLGNKLHELYPDEIRQIKTAEAMEKLGYIYPYEEVNMTIHRLENSFIKSNLEFSANSKWEIFENPFRKNMISNNNIVNFSFGYTYVGRQYYNKFEYFDDELKYEDHYNYETLESSFQLTLQKPQTIPYSKEFVEWANKTGAELITTQVPIANIDNLSDKLFDYRKILYRNSRDDNKASIQFK